MKKITIILLLLIVSLTACGFNKDVISIAGTDLDKNSQYVYNKNKTEILYQQYNKNNGGVPSYDYIPLKNVDMESFSILNENTGFAKDKHILYCEGRELKGNIDLESATIKSFEPEGVGKGAYSVLTDKDNVYYLNSKCTYDKDEKNFEIVKMSTVNPETVDFLTPRMVKDDNQYYYLCENTTSGSDVPLMYDSFDRGLAITSKTTWLRDDSSLGYFNNSCEFVNVSTDKTNITSFQKITDTGFYKNNQNVYYGTTKINIVADPMSFQLFNMNYQIFKDNTQYYYFKHNEKDKLIILDAQFDANSFQETSNKTFFKDNSNYYFKGKIINGIDYPSFEIVEGSFSKDKNTIYYRGEKLESIIPDFDKQLNPRICSYNVIETDDNYYRINTRGNEEEINVEEISKTDKKVKNIEYYQEICNK